MNGMTTGRHDNTSVRNSGNAAGQWFSLPAQATRGSEEQRHGMPKDGMGMWKNETMSSSTGPVSWTFDAAGSRPGISGPFGDMPESSWNSLARSEERRVGKE